MTEVTGSKRPVRSYVIRSGRLTESQRKAIDEHWQDYVVEYDGKPLQLTELFPQSGELTVEIGFGMGDSLLAMAEAHPEQNFLGIEVHKPGVGKLMHGIHQRGLQNLRIICHDAVEVLNNSLETDSIDRVLLLFPDPWPKKKHHKRRIVQPGFVKLLVSRLKTGGSFHLATDWEPYAEHMLEVLEQEPQLSNVNGKGKFWESPDRPPTKFEARGKRLGHGVWDLLYKKSN